MRLEVQAIEQKLLQHAGKRALGLQAHRGQAAALLQDALHMAAEVLVVFVGLFGRIEVGVARDLNHIGVFHRIHLENFVGDHLERVFEQNN